jgi:hypothetical protein
MRISISRDSKEGYAFLGIERFELLYWFDINILLHDNGCIKCMTYVYPNENT